MTLPFRVLETGDVSREYTETIAPFLSIVSVDTFLSCSEVGRAEIIQIGRSLRFT